MNYSTNVAYAVEHQSRCRAEDLIDSYGLTAQFVLALLAFCSLVFKRLLEPKLSRRSWVVWIFDVSKQGVGASITHMLNIALASLFHGDPCTWYFVFFVLDSTLGLCIIYLGIRTITLVASFRKQWSTLRFGEYGDPPRCRPWLHQCAAFVLLCLVEKLFMTFVMQMEIWQLVTQVALSPIQNPRVEVTLVVLVFPFLMNTIMFWMVDNFTMKKRRRVNNTPVNNFTHADDSCSALLDNMDSPNIGIDDSKLYTGDHQLQHRFSVSDT